MTQLPFDAATLDLLHRVEEVKILAGAPTAKPVVIWVVVDGADPFIRSVRGPKARWYVTAAAAARATLEAGDRRIPVRLEPATDATSVERASRAYLAKYRPSPYAEQMVRPEVLPTTLRLVPP